MAKRYFTDQEFHRAVLDLEVEGKNLTARALRKKMGDKGSFTSILHALRQYKSSEILTGISGDAYAEHKCVFSSLIETSIREFNQNVANDAKNLLGVYMDTFDTLANDNLRLKKENCRVNADNERLSFERDNSDLFIRSEIRSDLLGQRNETLEIRLQELQEELAHSHSYSLRLEEDIKNLTQKN